MHSGPVTEIQGSGGCLMAVVTKGGSKTSAREVIERAKADGVEVVDVRFIDLPGTWQHFSLPLGELDEDSFVTGLGFDGSSIRGFQAIDESDMMLVPDPDSATIDPVLSHKTRFLICDVVDPITREPYSLEAGVQVEVQHHEVGTAGQAEIDMRFDTLTKMGDKMMVYKYVIKNVAAQHGYVATFMPKPLFMDNGSGMHVHQSLWKDGENLFADKSGYAGLSQTAVYYIGGLLKHAPALLALCAPTTNSYRRLVPGYEAPINLVYSKRNRSACVRIPMYTTNPKAKRVEFRSPDPAANPYLAFAACLMAGLDGIKNKILPPEPVDKDIYELDGEEKAKIKSVPGSLGESLDALEKDHAFLTEGGVFTKDVVDTWIDYKRKREVDPIALRPHPWEFMLYSDV